MKFIDPYQNSTKHTWYIEDFYYIENITNKNDRG